MKILITGGGGFIGHHLAAAMAKENHEIFVLENFSRGIPERISWLEKSGRLIEGDVRSEACVKNAFNQAEYDAVFHLAAINGTENFYTVPIDVMDVGVLGCINVLRACKERGVKKLIVASSAEVYQDARIIPTPENIEMIIPTVDNPRYSYALSKIFTEYYSYQFGKRNQMNISIFRPHNIYGVNMGFKHVIPEITMALLQSRDLGHARFVPKGPVDVTRSFCHVDDLIHGLSLLLEETEGVEVYNIGNDREITIRQLVIEIGNALGLNVQINLTDGSNKHQGTAVKRCPDITKISKLGYKPTIDIRDGLSTTVPWYVRYHDSREDERNALV